MRRKVTAPRKAEACDTDSRTIHEHISWWHESPASPSVPHLAPHAACTLRHGRAVVRTHAGPRDLWSGAADAGHLDRRGGAGGRARAGGLGLTRLGGQPAVRHRAGPALRAGAVSLCHPQAGRGYPVDAGRGAAFGRGAAGGGRPARPAQPDPGAAHLPEAAGWSLARLRARTAPVKRWQVRTGANGPELAPPATDCPREAQFSPHSAG